MNNKRFAAHILMFDCQNTILRALENCGPFVEKIYVAYSEYPWNYNRQARSQLRNTADKKLLQTSPFYSKIELIEGIWDHDEDQRNACLVRARADGMDYLIIHDADEFYHPADYRNNLNQIVNNPDFEVYRTPWCSFWKNLDYAVVDRQGSEIVGHPEFAVNCKKDIRFIKARTTNAKIHYDLPGLCYHLSYVMTDQELWRKINTWSHSHQFDVRRWYRRKWLEWNEKTEDLHPLDPPAWKRAVRFTGELPPVLAGFPSRPVAGYRAKPWDGLRRWCEDGYYLFRKMMIRLGKL